MTLLFFEIAEAEFNDGEDGGVQGMQGTPNGLALDRDSCETCSCWFVSKQICILGLLPRVLGGLGFLRGSIRFQYQIVEPSFVPNL